MKILFLYESSAQPVSGTAPSADLSRGQAGMYFEQATGLYKAVGRWDDPKAKVWISVDPSGFASNDPNLYRAFDNNAARYTDPSGLCANVVFNTASSYLPTLTPYDFGASVVSDALLHYAGEQAGNDLSSMASAWVAQQNQQAAAQQQQISALQDYAYKLGTARSAASTAFGQANAAAASAWFPSSVAAAGDQAIQAQKAGIQLDTQIEQFRQSLLANPQYAGAVLPNSDVYSTLSSQSSFNRTLVGNATYWNNLINEPGLQSCADPVSIAAVTIMTAGMGSPLVAGTSSSMAGSAGAGTTASIIGAEARPIISQYVAGIGIDASGAAITDSALAPMVTTTLGASATSASYLTQSLAAASPSIASGFAPSAASSATMGETTFNYSFGSTGNKFLDTLGIRNATISNINVTITPGQVGADLLNTQAHEAFHVYVAQNFPNFAVSKRLTYFGAFPRYGEEVGAYFVGGIRSGQYGQAIISPFTAFGSLSAGQTISVIGTGAGAGGVLYYDLKH